MSEPPVPTESDIENAAIRQAVAERQNREWQEANLLALGGLGSSYQPWMRLSLIDSDYHNGASRDPVAVVIKVYRGEERLTQNSVYLRKMPDDTVKVADNYEILFGDLLTEPHPTRRLQVKGEMVAPPRWSLVWSALERYTPKSAESSAALRQ